MIETVAAGWILVWSLNGIGCHEKPVKGVYCNIVPLEVQLDVFRKRGGYEYDLPSKEACMEAGRKISNDKKLNPYEEGVMVTCVPPKGEKP